MNVFFSKYDYFFDNFANLHLRLTAIVIMIKFCIP